jgi:hypothetical protein
MQQFLIKRVSQVSLGVLIVPGPYGNSDDRNLGISRGRAAQFQQLQTAIARGRLRNGLQMNVGQEGDGEVKVLVYVMCVR